MGHRPLRRGHRSGGAGIYELVGGGCFKGYWKNLNQEPTPFS